MLCFIGKNTAQRVQQIQLIHPPFSNAHFFRQPKAEYYQHREPGWWGLSPFWREVKGVHFARFITIAPRGDTQWIRVVDLNSPPAPQKPWTQALGPVPPPSSYCLKQWLKYPDQAGERLGALCQFARIPRKVHGEMPLAVGHVGYGLYFREGTSESVLAGWILFQLFVIGIVEFFFPRSIAYLVLAGLLGLQLYAMALVYFCDEQDVHVRRTSYLLSTHKRCQDTIVSKSDGCAEGIWIAKELAL
jgi:hypothetical protein